MVSRRVKSKGGSPEEHPDRPPQSCCIVFCIISSNIHLESCDSESLLFESRSGSIIGTLNTGKNFYITSRNNKVDVPFDSGEGTCEIETRSGSIRIKIAQ